MIKNPITNRTMKNYIEKKHIYWDQFNYIINYKYIWLILTTKVIKKQTEHSST